MDVPDYLPGKLRARALAIGLALPASLVAGELVVSNQAAHLGAFGLEVRLTDTSPAFVQEDNFTSAETLYRARFYLHPNNLAMTDGDEFTLFEGRSDDMTLQFELLLVRSSGRSFLRLRAREDDGTMRTTSDATLRRNRFRVVEVLWRAASAPGMNDGRIRLFVDTVLAGDISDIDNDLALVDLVRLGAVAGIDAGTSNTFFLDVFDSRNTTYIGRAERFFGDTLAHFAEAFIDAVFAADITSGCGGGNYCPNDPVTRAQMAIFLLRGAEGGDFAPPPAGGSTGFGDVPTNHFAAAWIKELAARGITAGCGGGNYCPDDPVTRAQMAIFLLRAIGVVPPAGSGAVFNDVSPGHFAVDWIEELASRGVTSGCSVSPPLYCPGNTVTRGQMAIFLVRNFGLPLPFVP